MKLTLVLVQPVDIQVPLATNLAHQRILVAIFMTLQSAEGFENFLAMIAAETRHFRMSVLVVSTNGLDFCKFGIANFARDHWYVRIRLVPVDHRKVPRKYQSF